VIARIRELESGDRWWDYDDLVVTDTGMGIQWGSVRHGPFKLVIFVASPDGSGGRPIVHGGP
jgi:hypothetical protein